MAHLPRIVELETDSRCNRRCPYCPNSLFEREQSRLSEEVVARIFDELALLRFHGRLSFHFYNEPLLDNRIPSFVSQARLLLPDARIVLYTNGDLLNADTACDLVQRGCDQLLVTAHAGSTHDASWLDLLAPAVRWRIFYQSYANPDIVWTNRGGLLPHIERVDEPLCRPCAIPDTALVVAASGNIVLCYEDYAETQVMGSVLDQALSDIWQSEAYSRHRGRLRAGDRTGAGICRRCNNVEMETTVDVS